MGGLVLEGQVVVAGGELHLGNCTFAGSSADEGGALQLLAGAVHANNVSFFGCTARRGGAMCPCSTTAVLQVTTRNKAASRSARCTP